VIRVAAAALGVLSLCGTASPLAPDLFDDLHARTLAAEATRQTIRARFTQTTTSSLLVKPVVSRGTILGAKPAKLLMTYTSPERKTIVMDGTRLVVIGRDPGTSGQSDVTEIMKKVNHYFVNATPNDLRKSFTVRAFIDPEMRPSSYQVDLVPTRKQIRQGLERLQIWVTREPLLLSQIKMTFPGGDIGTITIDDAELNVPIPAHAFDVDLPPPAGQKK
jgi:outer membrane lipoprotein-sorting protein